MKKVVPIVVVLLIIIGVGLALMMHKDTPSNTSSNSASTTQTSKSQASTNPAPVAANAVTIQNFAFSPASITVKKGTTVTWTNQDSTAHTVTETDGQDGPKSQDLDNGQTYSFTYNTAGTFKYHCSIHSDMTGTVTVTE
jgi:plastocyanin